MCIAHLSTVGVLVAITVPDTESSKITIDNRRNSVIVKLPEKQYFKSVSVILILTLFQRPLLKTTKECSKIILFEKALVFLFQNCSHDKSLI